MRYKLKCKISKHNYITIRVDASCEQEAIAKVRDKYSVIQAEVTHSERYKGLKRDTWMRKTYPYHIKQGIYGKGGSVRIFG